MGVSVLLIRNLTRIRSVNLGQAKMLIKGTTTKPSLKMNGIDALLTIWTDDYFIYENRIDPNLLVSSLQKALDINPYFAGRELGIGTAFPELAGSNDGLWLEIEYLNENMPFDVEGRKFSCRGRNLIPKREGISRDSTTPLMQIKLTQFNNGSVLGIAVFHTLCDGTSFSNFLSLWSSIAKDKKYKMPNFYRKFSTEPLSEVDFSCAASEYIDIGDTPISAVEAKQQFNAPDFTESAFSVNTRFIDDIYSEHSTEIDDAAIMKDDIFCAFIWKAIVQCQEAPDDALVSLVSMINSRNLVDVGSTDVGNCLAWLTLDAPKNTVIAKTLPDIAESIRNLTFDVIENEDILQNQIIFLNKCVVDEKILRMLPRGVVSCLGLGTSINNIRQAPFFDLDFGSGSPCWVDTPFDQPLRGFTLFPSPKGNTEIILRVNLPSEEMAKFRASIREIGRSEIQFLY